MLVYKFHYKLGDREAPKVTDDLILTDKMARTRAVQELCDLFKIVFDRELRVTVTPDLDIGQKKFLSVGHLGIGDDNWITAISTTLSRDGCYDDVTIQTYKDMP